MKFWVVVEVTEGLPGPTQHRSTNAMMVSALTVVAARKAARAEMRNRYPAASQIKVASAEIAPATFQD